MFGSEIFEVVLSVVFIFLLLSLICSALTELIQAWLKLRSTDLEQGIRELLGDREGKGLARKLYGHPLVYGLYRGDYNPELVSEGRYKSRSNLPSYIPARIFAQALMDIVLPAAGASGSVTPAPAAAAPLPGASEISDQAQSFRDAIPNMENSQVEGALMPLVEAAGGDIGKVRENIEAWYDSSMDRIRGWYKRRTQVVLLVLGLIVAAAVNADTITIAKSISHDRALREALVTAAQQYAKTPEGEAGVGPAPAVYPNLQEMWRLSLPLGWNKEDPRTVPREADILAWATKILGWVLTAVAISLGAPFWFDLLNKIVSARSSVKPG